MPEFFAEQFDAEFPNATPAERERARRNAAEAGQPDTTPVNRPDGKAADRETRVRHRLAAYRFGPMSEDEIDYRLEKHGALPILVALSAIDRKEADGKVVGRPVAYLDAILAKQAQRGGGRKGEASGRGMGSDTPSKIETLRLEIKADAEAAGIPEPGAYADRCIESYDLARRIAAMTEETPERLALEAKYRKLPAPTAGQP